MSNSSSLVLDRPNTCSELATPLSRANAAQESLERAWDPLRRLACPDAPVFLLGTQADRAGTFDLPTMVTPDTAAAFGERMRVAGVHALHHKGDPGAGPRLLDTIVEQVFESLLLRMTVSSLLPCQLRVH